MHLGMFSWASIDTPKCKSEGIQGCASELEKLLVPTPLLRGSWLDSARLGHNMMSVWAKRSAEGLLSTVASTVLPRRLAAST